MTEHPIKPRAVGRAYAAFAPVYDLLFGRVLAPGRRAVVRSIPFRPGDRVLEVGVGTGLSLRNYPEDVRVTGIDLAPRMLDKARARVTRYGLGQVEDLVAMDAADLQFEDGQFDAVVAMYVVSVVDDPVQVVAEMKRVCKPGRPIVIINHFHTDSRLIRAGEVLLKPIHHAVRFRADLRLDEFTESSALEVERKFQVNVFGYSTVLLCRNGENGHAASP